MDRQIDLLLSIAAAHSPNLRERLGPLLAEVNPQTMRRLLYHASLDHSTPGLSSNVRILWLQTPKHVVDRAYRSIRSYDE